MLNITYNRTNMNNPNNLSKLAVIYHNWLKLQRGSYQRGLKIFLEEEGHNYSIKEIQEFKILALIDDYGGVEEFYWTEGVKKEFFDPYINKRLIELWKD